MLPFYSSNLCINKFSVIQLVDKSLFYLDDPSNCMNSMRKLHLPKNRRLLKPKNEGLVQIILPFVSGWCSNPCLSHYLQGLIQPKWCRISSINSIFSGRAVSFMRDMRTSSMPWQFLNSYPPPAQVENTNSKSLISIHPYPCAPPYNFKDLIKRVFCFFCQPTTQQKNPVVFGAPNPMGGNGDCTSTPLGHAGARFRKLRFFGATLPSEIPTTSGLGEMTDWKFRRSPEMTVGKRSQKK